MKWSQFQTDIFDAMGQADGPSILINAKAGSGKTSTIVEGTKRLRSPGIALAFNKRIAEELSSRLPSHIQAQTMNSLGHRAWSATIGKRLRVDTQKLWGIIDELKFPEVEREELRDSRMAVKSLISAARTVGLVPKSCKRLSYGLVPDTPESWEILADHFDLDATSERIELAREGLLLSIKMAYAGRIDFDDQIYMTALFGGRLQRQPNVLVDEAQDLSPLQHHIIKRLVEERLIAVGDPHQAIYGFRGASTNSMAELGEAFSALTLPLSVSYRCPRQIVLEAQKIVPDIYPSETARDGLVLHNGTQWHASDLPAGAAVLCRNNAPLFSLAAKLIMLRRPVHFIGQDIGKGLISTVRKVRGQHDIPVEAFLSRLRTWEEKEVAQFPKREARIRDRAESLRFICSLVSTTDELITTLEDLFTPRPQSVVLSSIHRSKGLEWQNVYILDSWRIPSKYATSDWQLEQEYNLLYVAITRAQANLIYIDGELT